MKRIRTYLLLLTMMAALVGTACGGATTPTSLPLESEPDGSTPVSSEGDNTEAGVSISVDPAAVVQVFFVSLFAGGDVSTFVCSEAPNLAGTFQQWAANTREGMGNATASIAGLQYTVSHQTAESAMVTVEGDIVFTANGVDTTVPYPETVIDVVVQDGSWKICGGIA